MVPSSPCKVELDYCPDLRSLSVQEASRFPLISRIALSAELLGFLIDSVSRTGGHLAVGLGVVDFTVALYYAFDTLNDRLIWDVGHQAYPQ